MIANIYLTSLKNFVLFFLDVSVERIHKFLSRFDIKRFINNYVKVLKLY